MEKHKNWNEKDDNCGNDDFQLQLLANPISSNAEITGNALP